MTPYVIFVILIPKSRAHIRKQFYDEFLTRRHKVRLAFVVRKMIQQCRPRIPDNRLAFDVSIELQINRIQSLNKRD